MAFTVEVSYALAFLAGLLSFLSPCTLPILPSFLAYLSGSADAISPGAQAPPRSRMMINAVMFVFGFTVVFVLLGASVSAVGELLSAHQDVLTKGSGVLLIFFGLFLTGWLRIPFLYRELRPIQWKSRPAGYAGALAVGFAFGVGWTPCVGPILGAILTLAGASQGVGQGIRLLTVYSLGLAIPFLMSAWLFHSLLGFIQRFRKVMRGVHVGGGLVLAGMGVLLLSGYFQLLNSYASALTPAWIVSWL
ncbi:MAG: cytochrome c biogenesis protein CcdA [bacterium]